MIFEIFPSFILKYTADIKASYVKALIWPLFLIQDHSSCEMLHCHLCPADGNILLRRPTFHVMRDSQYSRNVQKEMNHKNDST